MAGGSDIPAAHAAALHGALAPDETVQWWAKDNERFVVEQLSLFARLVAPVIVTLIALGAAIYSGDWSLTRGAILLCLIWVYFALDEPRSIFYAVTQHRLIVLRDTPKTVAVVAVEREQITEIWFSTQSESVCVAYSTTDGRRPKVVRMRGLHEPRALTRFLKKWRSETRGGSL